MEQRAGISSRELKRSLLINGLFFTCHFLYGAFPLIHPFFLIVELIGNAIAWGLTSAIQAMIFVMQWRLLKGRLHPVLRYASYALPTIGLFIILNFCVIPRTQKHNQRQSLESPSGKYTLRMPIENHRWRLKVYDAKGRLEYVDDSDFNGILSVYWVWDNADRVWLYNSDDGREYYWAKENGQWRRHLYDESSEKEFLAGIRPPLALFPDYALDPADEWQLHRRQLESPSGRYTMLVPEAMDRRIIAIYNEKKEKEYENRAVDLSSSSDYWLWDQADRLWFYREHEGIHYLEKRSGQWERIAWGKETAAQDGGACSPPQALVKVMMDFQEAVERAINRAP